MGVLFHTIDKFARWAAGNKVGLEEIYITYQLYIHRDINQAIIVSADTRMSLYIG